MTAYPDLTYRLAATVGLLDLEVIHNPAAPVTPTVPLLMDPASWSVAAADVESGLWPPAIDPAEVSLSLFASDASELSLDVQLGVEVTLQLFVPHDAATPLLDWSGVITEATIRPVDYDAATMVFLTGGGAAGPGLIRGVQCDISAADPVVRLREQVVGQADIPFSEPINDRISRLMSDAGQLLMVPAAVDGVSVSNGFSASVVSGDKGSGPLTVAARPPEPVNLYDAVMDLLRQWPAIYPRSDLFYTLGYARLGLKLEPGATITWRIFPTMFEQPTVELAPLRLELDLSLGLYRLILRPTTLVISSTELTTYVVDGGAVEWDTSFVLTKANAINRVEVTGKFGGTDDVAVATTGQSPQLTTQMATDLVTKSDAQAVAKLYLPDVNPVPRWAPDALVWRLELQSGSFDGFTDDYALPQIGQVVTVGPVLESQSPSGREWMAGQVASVDLTISGGRIEVQLQLVQGAFDPGAVGQLMKYNTARPGSLQYSQLLPRDTYNDYRLARGTTA